MKKLFILLFMLFLKGYESAAAADAFPAANVEYVQQQLNYKGCYPDFPTNTMQMGINMEYLLTVIDICNNGQTQYGTGEFVSAAWANTNAVDWCVQNLILPPALPNYVQDGLILLLMNITNSQKTIWQDLSGNENNFTMSQIPIITDNSIEFFGQQGQQVKSQNKVNLSIFDAITVESRFMPLPSQPMNVTIMIFELTNNWNSNTGGLGMVLNSNGSQIVQNSIHTNHRELGTADNSADFFSVPPYTDGQFHTVTTTFSSVPNAAGKLLYFDGQLINGNRPTAKSSYHPIANDIMYIGRRGNSATSRRDIGIQSFRIYSRQLSAAEVCQNSWADYNYFGGLKPSCTQ